MLKIYVLFYFLLSFSISLIAQAENNQQDEHHFQHHEIAISTAFGIIPKAIDNEGKNQSIAIPIIAFDYEYWFNHKIGLALANDIELVSYRVEKNEDEYIDRENAFATSLLFLYEPIPGLKLFAGPGYEFEKNESFELFKIGTSLTKKFKDGWVQE